ncbi:RING-H2 finger protein ATL20-like [Vigna umbellata]|uniref:RING-H2 finger protein ATL20-like n=1 Tax=Vigna umbellata TaxID=87088 RepID=UPI001F5FA3F4|nr:RING-H2 finger protein ATL20-like [Vigna umbellata]
MATSPMLCAFCLLLFHLQTARGNTNQHPNCNTLRCGHLDILFPFGLKQSNQDPRCSYFPVPSFQLSCINRTQPVIDVPGFGNLVVKNIDYDSQSILVNDPNGCLPKRFLHGWNLSGSPFILNPRIYGSSPFNLTFVRCPSNVQDSSQFPLMPISCLSDDRNSVIASWSQPIVSSTVMPELCQVMSHALVPIPVLDMPMWPFWSDLNTDLELVWTEPRCSDCALSGQVCGFSDKKNQSLRVGCFPRDSGKGLSRSAKYGLAIGVGIPGLLCFIGMSCFVCGKFRTLSHRRRGTHLPITISLQPVPFAAGLDGATIEKYPKTLIGESGRLLKPSDNTCAICLSEYEPKETLRSIPECDHYFHADCIDEWLKLNGTCPLCRNSPETSTASFSSSSPTSSSFSSPQ